MRFEQRGFNDAFQRPDGQVRNGWVTSTANAGTMSIVNGQVAISQVLPTSEPVAVTRLTVPPSFVEITLSNAPANNTFVAVAAGTFGTTPGAFPRNGVLLEQTANNIWLIATYLNSVITTRVQVNAPAASGTMRLVRVGSKPPFTYIGLSKGIQVPGLTWTDTANIGLWNSGILWTIGYAGSGIGTNVTCTNFKTSAPMDNGRCFNRHQR